MKSILPKNSDDNLKVHFWILRLSVAILTQTGLCPWFLDVCGLFMSDSDGILKNCDQYSFEEWGSKQNNNLVQESHALPWRDGFVYSWSNDGFATSDGIEWWNGCQCQLVETGTTLIGCQLTKPDEQSIRKVKNTQTFLHCVTQWRKVEQEQQMWTISDTIWWNT